MFQDLPVRVVKRILSRWPRLYGSRFVQRFFWDMQAKRIDALWGQSRDDWDAVSIAIARTRTNRVLDVGCGSGRLFPLYLRLGVNEIVGQDISSQAIRMVTRRFRSPNIRLTQTPIPELDYEHGYFDLVVSNRVLQHIPPNQIRHYIASLCHLSKSAYINEVSDTDGLPSSSVMQKHDYKQLFADQGHRLMDSGTVGKQTWFLFVNPTAARKLPLSSPRFNEKWERRLAG